MSLSMNEEKPLIHRTGLAPIRKFVGDELLELWLAQCPG